MKYIFILFSFLTISETITAQTKTFKGAWFDITYPSSFFAKGSLKSLTSDGFESDSFKSPDNLVEFYVFSPQWNGEATDILIGPKEKLGESKSQIKGDVEINWWTIIAEDGTYSRSYEEKLNKTSNTKYILGIKYKNSSALEKYKKEYMLFKNSLIQYAD